MNPGPGVWHLVKTHNASEHLTERVYADAPSMPESDDEEADMLEADLRASSEGVVVNRPMSAAELEAGRDCKMHIYSRVVHIGGGPRFLCGRSDSANYSRLDLNVPLSDLPICAQCARSSTGA